MGLPENLLEEWDHIKNWEKKKLVPNNVSTYSSTKVYWICKNEVDGACGCHRWKATVNNRARGHGCPYCAKKKICLHDSLLYLHPELSQEWDYERNVVKPSEIAPNSYKRAWWICKNGTSEASDAREANGVCRNGGGACGCHRWSAVIAHRVKGQGCPYCAGRDVCMHTYFGAIKPELLQEWDYKKNPSPFGIKHNSTIKVSWICKNNVCGCHVWEASVISRFGWKGCPYCEKRVICIHNSLFYKYPELMNEWDYTKNIFSPASVDESSNAAVGWVCSKDISHEWRDSIKSRVRGSGCPHCTRLGSIKDVFSVYPHLALEWDHNKSTMNDPWWICNRLHSWQASIKERISGKECEACRLEDEEFMGT